MKHAGIESDDILRGIDERAGAFRGVVALLLERGEIGCRYPQQSLVLTYEADDVSINATREQAQESPSFSLSLVERHRCADLIDVVTFGSEGTDSVEWLTGLRHTKSTRKRSRNRRPEMAQMSHAEDPTPDLLGELALRLSELLSNPAYPTS